MFANTNTKRHSTFAMLLAAACVIRLVWFFLDSQPRMFMGDSQSYLDTGVNGWYPDDRSWTFGLLLNRILALSGSLSGYLLFQTLFSALAIAIIAHFSGWLGARAPAQWLVLVMMSLEPLWIHYDRAMLTDSMGSSLFMMGLIGGMVAVAQVRFFLAGASGVALAAAVSLRTALIPPVLLALLVLAVLGVKGGLDANSLRRKLAASAAALAALIGIGWNGATTGQLAKTGWTLNPRDGYFLVGPVATMLTAEDFAAAGYPDGESLLLHDKIKDRLWRNAQIYLPDGIMGRLERRLGDPRQASGIASKAAHHAVLRDPLGYVQLVALQFGDYVDERLYRRHFDYWFGLSRPLSPEFLRSIQSKAWEGVGADLPARVSATLEWLRQLLWYPPVLVWMSLLLPFVAVWRAATLRGESKLVLLGLALICLGYLASICMFSAELVPRYLMPLAPLVLLQLTLISKSFSNESNEIA